MFLDALRQNASGDGMAVEVTTTSDEPKVVQHQFNLLQEDLVSHGVKLRYSIHNPNKGFLTTAEC